MKGFRADAFGIRRSTARLRLPAARPARPGRCRATRVAARLACLLPVVLALLLARGAGAEAASSRRLAFLVGDGSYPASDLPQTPAAKDAGLLAAALRDRGFTVDLGTDLTRQMMEDAVDGFLAKVTPGSIVLVYFNGIGIKVANRTYLLPVDAAAWNEGDVRRFGVNVDSLLYELDRRGARIKVAILDVARPNPFERNFRDHALGLAGLDLPPGTLALHAVARNKVGFDAGSEPSLFMRQFVRRVREPDIGAAEAMTRTRDDVAAMTGGAQMPWIESTLVEPFAFDPNRPDPPRAPPVTAKEERREAPASRETPLEPVQRESDARPADPRPADPHPVDPCVASVTERDGIVSLALEDRARAGQQTRLTLDGLTYGSHFDRDGHLRVEAPLLHATGDLLWEGAGGRSCARRDLAFSNYGGAFMLALVWDTYVSLALHVVEPPSGRIGGSTYYLNPERPNLDGRAALGVLRVFGEAVPGTTQVQVYILPPARNPRRGEVYAFIEFASRGTPARRPYCGDNPKAIVSFKLFHLEDGRLDSRNGRFGSLDCGTVWAGDPETSGYYQRWKWRL